MLSKASSMPMCSWGQVKKNGASFARACSHLKWVLGNGVQISNIVQYSTSQRQPREDGKGQQPSLVDPCYRIIRLNCYNCYRMVDNYFWLLFETHASLAIGNCCKAIVILFCLQEKYIVAYI